MIFRAPIYYKSFHCIADKCKDNCCSAGWEIDIDSETEEFYMNVKGDFGKKLRENISICNNCNNNCSTQNTTAYFKLNKNNNCPFLNNNNLCNIYINLGEEHLCQICKDHPRFYEWFDYGKEAGIGLCCEEAARIILSQTEDFSYYEEKISDDTNECDYNTDLYNYLFTARNTIITYLNKSDISFDNKLRNILWYGHTLQQNIDNDLLDDEEIFDVKCEKNTDIKEIIKYFSSLDFIDNKWPDYLKKCANLSKTFNDKMHDFENANPDVENYLNNISLYFIWRYFLKSVFDGDVLSKIKFMYVNCHLLKFLFFCKWLEYKKITLENCIDIVKKFSEEIEYCEENVSNFYYDSYNMKIFETNFLLGLCY